MADFKKEFYSKIVTIVVAGIFFLNSTVYGIDLHKNSHIRVPINNNRLKETLSLSENNTVIDINMASREELEKLFGLLPQYSHNPDKLTRMVNRLIENRPYRDISGLREVPGIGDSALKTITQQLSSKIIFGGQDDSDKIVKHTDKTSLFIIEDLEGQLNAKVFWDIENKELLTPETIDRIREHVTWIKMEPDKFSGARSIVLKLKKPILIGRKRKIAAIKIKGVVFFDGEKAYPPSSEIFNPDIHRISGTVFISQGYFDFEGKKAMVKPAIKHPKGGLPNDVAKYEYEITKRALKDMLNVNLALGYGEFTDMPFRNGKVGFVILGIEDVNDERVKDLIEGVDKSIPSEKSLRSVSEQKMKQIVRNYVNSVSKMLFEIGKALRGFHDKGYFHGQPHPGQFSWNSEHITFHDLTQARYVPLDNFNERLVRRFLDIRSSFAGAQEVMRGEYNFEVLQTLFSFAGKNPFIYLLKGYFYDFNEIDVEKFFREVDILTNKYLYPPRYFDMAEERIIDFESESKTNYAVALIRKVEEEAVKNRSNSNLDDVLKTNSISTMSATNTRL